MGAAVGIILALTVVGAIAFSLRAYLPIDQLKLGVSMFQVLASASSAYDIPWPPQFLHFLDGMRVFLVDVVSVSRISCAQVALLYWH